MWTQCALLLVTFAGCSPWWRPRQSSGSAAADSSLAERTWVLITESPEGGWGIDGHAHTGAEIADAARRELSDE